MKLLIAASESAPFAATGGLGDVIGSLPAALKSGRPDDDIRVVLPLYGSMDPAWREKLTFVGDCRVQLNWRNQYCGLFRLTYKHVTYYFIDNEYYFARERLYGEFDDGERFAFFCRAIPYVMELTGFYPDLLHANDWQTALAVIYLKRKYRDIEPYSRIRTVFTIHNIQYQGNFDGGSMADVFDLLPSDWETVELNGRINLMKGAIVCADRVTTVSPTYAREILTPAFSFGLDGILNRFGWKLSGILNGIDRDYYSPSGEDAKNGVIPAGFHVNRMEGKAVCKRSLQNELGLPEDPDVPLVAMIGRMVDAKGLDLVTACAEMLMGDSLQLAVLGTGEPYYEQFFRELADRHPDKCKTVLKFDKYLAKRIYAGADIFLMPSRSEPCGLAQMICSRYGTVPVVHETGGLYDSIRDAGRPGGGNGFTFAEYSAWEMLNAIRRATGCYRVREDWKKLVRRVMLTDFSWDASAEQYRVLFDRLTEEK